MAQKQYSFDFVLNAVLNGGFSGTFTKAQQEFIRLGNEIKNLQAIQRDIAAYQKQQQAVQNTTGKLENLKKQYELINKQISETTGSITALEREKLKLEQRITSTEAALEKQREKLNDTKERLDAAGVSTDDLAGKDAALTEKIKELTEEQKKAAEGAKEFGNASVEAIQGVADAVAAAGIAKAVKGIADAYSECVGVAGDFEQAMSAVEAIAEANNREMTALTAEAKELGATTIYTAQQSANAMEYMAMAGWDAQEMLAGMKGMTTLAAAAGEDLAQVSDIVTDNLTAFGMQASDTAHFADVLAAAAANSNTNISIMGETFKSSSAVAGALGYSIEDVAVMVGLMANNAVKGSRAGTALRNIFNGLLSGATLTAEAFGELDYTAVNTDGTMKGLMETVNDLRYYFDQMTEAERVNNAMNIAGMRGYNGLLAILNATDEDFQSLYDSINNCSGAAERMASVKLDNLNGDVTIMNSAMEALQNTIGEQFNPELRELARTGTEVLNWANGFIQENPALVKGVMAGGAAFIALGTAIVGVNAAIKVFKALNLVSLFTGPAGVLLGVAGGIAVATAAVVAFNESMKNSLDETWELTAASREQYRQLQEMNAEYERACDVYGETSYEAQALKWQVDDLANKYEAGRKTVEEYRAAHEALMDSYQEMSSSHAEAIGSINTEEASVFSLIKKLAELSKTSESAAQNQDAILAIINELNKVVPELAISYDSVAAGADGYIQSLYDMAKAQATAKRMAESYEEYVERVGMRDALAAAKENAEENARIAQEEYEAASKAYNDAAKMYQYASDGGLSMALGTRAEAAAVDEAAAQRRIYNQALEEATAAYEENEATLAALEGTFRDYADAQADAAEEETTIQGLLTDTRARLQELAEAYTEAYEAAKDSFEGQFGLFDEAKADADATLEAAQAALDTQLAYWQEYAANIAALKEISAEDLGVTQENYDALMQYVRSGGPQAAGLAAEMVKAINEGNTKALTDLATTLGEISESQEQAAQDVADWSSGLTEQMDELIREIGEDIAALDMSPDAMANGRATIQAYINAAEDMLPQVQAAYAKVANAAKTALANNILAAIDYHPLNPRDIPTPGELLEMTRNAPWRNGYASGTESAPPGWAWVGENGPELMRMSGGEQILPAEVSRRLAEDYSLYNSYSSHGVQQARTLEVVGTGNTAGKIEMHFHIEAGASPETVSAWEEYARSGALKAVVMEVMEDAEADARRRAMT